VNIIWEKSAAEKKLKELQIRTNQLFSDLEINLNDFEKKGDAGELISRLKESIKQFQNETKDPLK
jgi:hypothetical protein